MRSSGKICEGIDCPLAYGCRLHAEFREASFFTPRTVELIKERFDTESKTCPDYEEEHRFSSH